MTEVTVTLTPLGIAGTIPAENDDATKIATAEDHFANERMFLAAELLEQVHDTSLLTSHHAMIADLVERARHTRATLQTPHDRSAGWHQQAESHDDFDFVVYYKTLLPSHECLCRIESLIQPDLLIPLVSVLNESDLYDTWMPHWSFPRCGLRAATMVAELGRGHQVIDTIVDLPFPFSHRQVYQHAYAIDSLDADGAIIICVHDLDTGTHLNGAVTIPAAARGVKRISLDIGMMIRAATADDMVGITRKTMTTDMLVLSMFQIANAHVTGVPIRLSNFFNRVVLKTQWSSLLHIAREVQQGGRPHHQAAIAAKPALYDFVKTRVAVLLERLDGGASKDNATTAPLPEAAAAAAAATATEVPLTMDG